MTGVVDGQGQQKGLPGVYRGMIVAYYGPRVPTGWKLCDGTNGTPDLRGRVLLGDVAVGVGSAGGTTSMVTGLTHAGFALGNHSNHAVTQPSAHSAHAVTQPAAHSSHVAAQPADHGTHSSEGAHTHDAHVLANTGSIAVSALKLTGPTTHSSDGAHTHDAHSAHSGWGVDAHSAHAGATVDAHSAHAGMTVDAHDAHVIGQPATHIYKHLQLAYIQRQ